MIGWINRDDQGESLITPFEGPPSRAICLIAQFLIEKRDMTSGFPGLEFQR
jgi:hypothetical protein